MNTSPKPLKPHSGLGFRAPWNLAISIAKPKEASCAGGDQGDRGFLDFRTHGSHV